MQSITGRFMITRVFSTYTLIARVFPTILCAVPFLMFQYFVLSPGMIRMFSWITNYFLLYNFTVSVIIIYFLSLINRFISKLFFEQSEEYMPTTEFMLLSNGEFSSEYKILIYKKIKSDFGITLPDAGEQDRDELRARKRIAEAIGLVRKKVGNGVLLLQHNYEYGFARNLVGASSVSTVLVIILLVCDIILRISFFQTRVLVLLLLIYLLPFMFHRIIIRKFGSLYARTLLQEYLALKP